MALTTITNFGACGEVRVGANGVTPGAAECAAGLSPASQSTGRRCWATSLAAGLDSGWVAVALTANAGGGSGGVQWAVDAATPEPVTYSGAAYGEVLGAKLRAAVRGPGRRASFRNVVVEFYTNQADADPDEATEVAPGSAPVASTMGQQEGDEYVEQILTVTPDGSGYAKLRVRADVRFEGSDTTLPNSADLMAQVFLLAEAQ